MLIVAFKKAQRLCSGPPIKEPPESPESPEYVVLEQITNFYSSPEATDGYPVTVIALTSGHTVSVGHTPIQVQQTIVQLMNNVARAQAEAQAQARMPNLNLRDLRG